MAALFDVSKMITVFQRLCHFAEEFTEEHRGPLSSALTAIFQEDLEEGQEIPNVDHLITSLLRRLRHTLEKLVESEAELIIAVKENSEFGTKREELTRALREAFDRARAECRNHFGRVKADLAGFPARLAVNTAALLRQTKVVSMKMRQGDFDLGDPLIRNSSATAETILEIFESEVEGLRSAMSAATRRRARMQGRQVVKDKEMRDFRATYSLFVNMVRSSFRLAGQDELARRLTLSQARNSSTSSPVDPSGDEDPSTVDDPKENPPQEPSPGDPSMASEPSA